jgi:thiosulfate/3-mercaptopyruvate sulfurtransferase
MTPEGPLVSSEWLLQHLEDPNLRILDVRYYLDGRDNWEEYRARHIPGARYVDMETVATGAEGPGRHPLPTRDELEAAMQSLGVDTASTIVVYDDSFPAPRLRWTLRHYGHENVAVLDGGLAAWPGPFESGVPRPWPAGNFTATDPIAGATVGYDEVAALLDEALVLDARAPDRFRGEVAPGDPRLGRIPGARNAHWQAVNLSPDGHFRAPEDLRRSYAALGVDGQRRTIAYCGSGVQACHLLLGLELAGLDDAAQLYVGSWSDWSRHPGAPAEIDP